MKRLKYVWLVILTWLLAAPTTHAALIVECAKRNADGTRGDCQLVDFVRQFVILQQWALGFVAVLAVLMFIWAGFQFITAGGRPDKVESGKRIIGGTITGIIISFAAYVIVNFAIFSLTGISVKSRDFWAGPIALLFPNESTTLQRPWSGLQAGDNRTSCRGSNVSTWDKSCGVGSASNPMQIYCADPGDTETGVIHDLQTKLSSHGCNCFNVGGQQADGSQTPDGCYGPDMTRCVQNFQVANRLPPSGMIDQSTSAALNSASAETCDPTFVNSIVSKIPAIKASASSSLSATQTGCCVVGAGTDADYCLNDVTEKTCGAISTYAPDAAAGVTRGPFEASKDCSIGRFKDVCGYCRNPLPTITGAHPEGLLNLCYQYVSENWCKTNGMPVYIFTPGPSVGAFQCKTALLLKPEP